jgi:hypothetical protein
VNGTNGVHRNGTRLMLNRVNGRAARRSSR